MLRWLQIKGGDGKADHDNGVMEIDPWRSLLSLPTSRKRLFRVIIIAKAYSVALHKNRE